MRDLPLRVLHVVGAMNRGGAESMLMSLYRGMDKTRYQFDFLEFVDGATDFSEEIEALGGRVLKLCWSQSPRRFRETLRSTAELIRSEGPYAAVHSHVLFASGAVLMAARMAGVPVRIAHAHNTSDAGATLADRTYRALSRSLIRRNATAQLACSRDAGRYLFGAARFEKSGVIIPNAVDVEKFHPPAPMADGHRWQTTGKMVLVSVARLEEVKNHKFLIEVAHELRARGVEFTLKLVGRGSRRSVIEAEIEKRGLGHWIEMVGVREDVAEILRTSDALLMPSLWEGLPVALVEAQATGLPCFVSDTITRDADLGVGLISFLPIDRATGWADAIEQSFPPRPTSTAIRNALASRGYTVTASLDKLLPIYSSIERTP